MRMKKNDVIHKMKIIQNSEKYIFKINSSTTEDQNEKLHCHLTEKNKKKSLK